MRNKVRYIRQMAFKDEPLAGEKRLPGICELASEQRAEQPVGIAGSNRYIGKISVVSTRIGSECTRLWRELEWYHGVSMTLRLYPEMDGDEGFFFAVLHECSLFFILN